MSRPLAFTRHALNRARLRWLLGTDHDAKTEILRVYRQGERTQQRYAVLYRLGTHEIVVVNSTVVTVKTHGTARVKWLLHTLRKARRQEPK